MGRNADDHGMQKKPYYRITSRVEIPASNLYFVWRGDEEFGPYAIQQIRHYWETGLLVNDDFIRESHCSDWIDASSFLLPILTSEKTHPYLPLPCPDQEESNGVAPPVEAEKIPKSRSSPWLKWLGGCVLLSLMLFVYGCSSAPFGESSPERKSPQEMETQNSPAAPSVTQSEVSAELPLRVWGEPVGADKQLKIMGARELPAMPSLVESEP
jgi:hypothetical protein